jgi:hypothetical protein
MTVDAGQGGGYLNFVAEIRRMPEYPWQCLDFPGTGQLTNHFVISRLSSFLILIARFATLIAWSVKASHPCTT